MSNDNTSEDEEVPLTQTQGFALTALIFSLVSGVLFFLPMFGMPLAVLSFLFGLMSNAEKYGTIVAFTIIVSVVSVFVNALSYGLLLGILSM